VANLTPGGGRAQREVEDGVWSRVCQVAVAVLGIAALSAGGVATFISSNGAGSAGLVASGAALLLFVLFGERIEWLKFANVEFHLREAARGLTRQAAHLEAQGHTEAAEELRDEARRLLLHASPAARAYEELRRTRPPGAQRVIELSKIVSDARHYSRAERPSADAVREIFFGGGDGERVYALALMEEDPDVGDLESILDAISNSHSAFEQGQSLMAALQIAPRLRSADKARLSEAVQEQLMPDGHISRSTDRHRVARQLLSVLSD
jgi:hypothetical protein